MHVAEFLVFLKCTHVSLRLSKCAFFCATVTFLFHFVKPGKIAFEFCSIEAQDEGLLGAMIEFYGFSRYVQFLSKLSASLPSFFKLT